jgi:hypothetical protein
LDSDNIYGGAAARNTTDVGNADTQHFRLILRAEPKADAVRVLRQALKVLLRRYKLRCISIEEVR